MTATQQKLKTRARVVDLLRRGQHTVDELARALQLTDNAVRMHLSALERDGVVCSDGVRRSGTAGKPATIYGIAPKAEVGFSQAYAPVMASLLETLGQRLSHDEMDTVMRAAGRRLGQTLTVPPGPLQKRARDASVLLNELGGITTVDGENGTAVLRGGTCPLAVAVRTRSEVCSAVQEMLDVMVGAEVKQRCHQGAKPTCCFILEER